MHLAGAVHSPARLNLAIAQRLKSCVSLETQLQGVSKACDVSNGFRFTTPMGFPIALGVEQEAARDVQQSTEPSGGRPWIRGLFRGS